MDCADAGSLVLPAKAFDEAIDVAAQKLYNRCEGIGVGRGIEVERAADKVATGVSEVKLDGGGRIAADFVKCAVDAAFGVAVKFLADVVGPHGMFIGERTGVFEDFGQISFYRPVAEVKPCMQFQKVDIRPARLIFA